MAFIYKLFVIIICVLVAPKSYGQSVIPDSVLYKEVDLSLMYYPSDPWTPGCDSLTHSSYPGQTYYYNADSVFHLIATRPISEIRYEVHYLYFILNMLVEYKNTDPLREKLLAAIDRYHSDALKRELDILDTYCYFNPDDTELGREWDYFWKLVEKYDRKGDLQTKMRIMERLLSVSCGYHADFVKKNIERGLPVIKLINEILDTQDRIDKRGEYYLLGAAHLYNRVAQIYYHFNLFDKAVPLLRKAARMPADFAHDHGLMAARDYLGDYYFKVADYDRSDSLCLAMLNNPGKVTLRPLEIMVAISRIAGNAKCRGQKHEAIRIFKAAVNLALEVGDKWYSTMYAVNLARIYLEAGEMHDAKLWMDRADEYYCNGIPRTVKWWRYYELSRDYYLKMGNAAAAALYIDSIERMKALNEEIRNPPILFNAHEQAYEAGLTLKEEQLRSERTRVVFVLIILAMSLLLWGVLLYFYRKLQAKNRNLFNQIREQDLLATRNDALVRLPKADKADIAEEQANRRLHELFVRTRAYLLEDRNFLKADLDTHKMIADLSTNRLYLFEAIKTITGKTMQEYINDLRLEEAKRLLESTDEIIESIAAKCGYSSVRTFYRLFGVRYGMSPAVYRRLAKEEERVKSEK